METNKFACLQYEFSKKVESDLSDFYKKCKKHKCTDTTKLKLWEQILPLQKMYESFNNAPVSEIIDLVEDTDPKISEENPSDADELMFVEQNVSIKITVKDLAYAITENLGSEELSKAVLDNILNFSETELQQLFILLESLNSDEVCECGHWFLKSSQHSLLANFCKYLFLPKCMEFYSFNLSSLFSDFSHHYFDIIKTEVLNVLCDDSKTQDNEILLQYLAQLNSRYQVLILSEFIARTTDLTASHFKIINKLLNKDFGNTNFRRLVELLTSVAEEFSSDKILGSLLMNIIKLLDTNIMALEKPLKYLISTHKSIYKSKLSKTFLSAYEDSFLLSQTLGE